MQRQFTAAAPDRLWVADITSVPTWAGFRSLAVVLDVHRRRIVGWAMADHLRSALVIEAVDMAVWRRRPREGIIHHSDQGSQDTSLALGRRLREPDSSVPWAVVAMAAIMRQCDGRALLRHA